MPEALESILTDGSKVRPRVAVLKPISAAVAIGSGGPFGAEGPIILTGGACGSVLAQFLHLTADERKTLLVAGAAGGMAATFNAPFASVLLAVELLLFEWRPRSYVPVTTAVAAATVLRHVLLGGGVLFPVPPVPTHISALAALFCVVAGLGGGLLAVAATALVYGAEDSFSRLPVHWMWWPAIGGGIIGIGGLFVPQALGVGYDVIGKLLAGRAALHLVIGILVVKTLIWSLSLGSGTSGGVLAPVFMLGGALGAVEALVFPGVSPGFWALVSLAAVLGGVMRTPLTGVAFAVELTGQAHAIFPLLISASSAYALSVLVLKRSVLTEKIARHGYHLTREYSIDPLEVLFVREVAQPLRADGSDVRELGAAPTAYPDETLREVAYRMADTRQYRMLVLDRSTGLPTAVVELADLLEARRHDLQEERVAERVLVLPIVTRGAESAARTTSADAAAPSADGKLSRSVPRR
jgi:H+/Cl- antiporter ClcA